MLLAQFTRFIKYVHVLLQCIYVGAQFFIKPWIYYIVLPYRSSIGNGLLPFIGKIVFGIIPILFMKFRMSAVHIQSCIIQQLFKISRRIAIKFSIHIVGVFNILVAHTG